MSRLEAYSTFGDCRNEPARELAARLAEHAPMPDARVFFTTGGGESIDTAAKLVRQYWSVQGQPGEVHMITALRGLPRHQRLRDLARGHRAQPRRLRPARPDTSDVVYDSVEALEQEILRIGPDRVSPPSSPSP